MNEYQLRMDLIYWRNQAIKNPDNSQIKLICRKLEDQRFLAYKQQTK